MASGNTSEANVGKKSSKDNLKKKAYKTRQKLGEKNGQ